MDANCAHLGADLGCGTVVGDTLQCPFHNWRYGADGVCTSVPHAAQIPAFARLRTYPVVEQHGSVFSSTALSRCLRCRSFLAPTQETLPQEGHFVMWPTALGT